MSSFHRGEWLSLAQAIGGMLAVAAAALVPFVHGLFVERRKRRAQLRALDAICVRLTLLLDEVKAGLKSDSDLYGLQLYGADAEWGQLLVTLAAFPVWDLANESVAVHIGHIRDVAARGERLCAACLRLQTVNEPQAGEIEEAIAGCKVTIEAARELFTRVP